jgi:sugar phosphate isomerase/epimerase
MIKPKICHSIGNLREFSFEDYDFEGYEFKAEAPGFKPNIIILSKIKERFKEKDLSLHSQLSRIFSCNDWGYPEFINAELEILKSEIYISKLLGIKQINFHMKETEFSEKEINDFNEIINLANQNGIEMIYENHVCSEEVIFRVLDTFPKVNFCLDLGHLNVAIHKGLFKMPLEDFLKRVKLRLVHIHAHNNFGERDEHNSIAQGNLDWKFILDNLKNSNLRKIIFENRTKKEVDESKKLIYEYYQQK